MKTRSAYGIFRDINNDKFTDLEKGEAIREVMGMVTHMGVTKDDMLNVIKYLWGLCFEEEAGEETQ